MTKRERKSLSDERYNTRLALELCVSALTDGSGAVRMHPAEYAHVAKMIEMLKADRTTAEILK